MHYRMKVKADPWSGWRYQCNDHAIGYFGMAYGFSSAAEAGDAARQHWLIDHATLKDLRAVLLAEYQRGWRDGARRNEVHNAVR